MVQKLHTARRPMGLPPSGGRALFIGDSISDNSIATSFNGGKYGVILSNTYSWRMLGVNAIPNANFETDASSWTVTGGALASDATHAQFGTKALKITPSGASCQVNPEGDAGAIRLGMRANQTWTFSCYVWVPTGTTGTWNIQIIHGTSPTYASTTVAVTPVNNWQRITVTATIGGTATESFVRIANVGATSGQAIWLDGAMLEPNSTPSTWIDSLRASNQLPGMGGTTLVPATMGGTAQNFADNLATRFTPYPTPDLVCMYYGNNDIGLGGAGGLTREGWRSAMLGAIQTFMALPSTPVIVILGLGWITGFVGDATAVTGWGVGATRAAVYSDMNAITLQCCRDMGVPFVDLSAMVVGDTIDGLHPTQAGHDKIVTAVKRIFGQ